MAIYHLRVTPVSRAGTTVARSAHHTGTVLSRGALGRSAYLSGEKLRDSAGGVVDYRSKEEGIDHAELFMPHGLKADRGEFWRSVDAHPVRKDAKNPTVARDIIVALPHELSVEGRRECARELCRVISERYSVGVDLGIHVHTKAELRGGSDVRNVHAHILVSERMVQEDGTLGNLHPDLNVRRARAAGRPHAVRVIREEWERIANEHLAREGHSARISRHRKPGARRRMTKEDYEKWRETREVQAEGPGTPGVGTNGASVNRWVRDPWGAFVFTMQSQDRADALQRRIGRARRAAKVDTQREKRYDNISYDGE